MAEYCLAFRVLAKEENEWAKVSLRGKKSERQVKVKAACNISVFSPESFMMMMMKKRRKRERQIVRTFSPWESLLRFSWISYEKK